MVASGDLDHWVVLSGRYFEYLRAAISSIMMRSSSLPTGLCESSHLGPCNSLCLARRKLNLRDREEPGLTKVGEEEKRPLVLLSLVSKNISAQWTWGRPAAAYATGHSLQSIPLQCGNPCPTLDAPCPPTPLNNTFFYYVT